MRRDGVSFKNAEFLAALFIAANGVMKDKEREIFIWNIWGIPRFY